MRPAALVLTMFVADAGHVARVELDGEVHIARHPHELVEEEVIEGLDAIRIGGSAPRIFHEPIEDGFRLRPRRIAVVGGVRL